jgi:hypothetical protein
LLGLRPRRPWEALAQLFITPFGVDKDVGFLGIEVH